jgi:pimeloyl-ACP methyl ester carboxylesterase
MPTLVREGADIHYAVAGSGEPAFVFVHGFTCALDDWRGQMSALADQHRVTALDLRCHGASTGTPEHCTMESLSADVVALVRALDLREAVLVGHSMGCRLVLQASADEPARVAGVVLIDGSNRGDAGMGDVEAAHRAAIAAAGGYAAFTRGQFAEMFVSRTPQAERIVARALALPEAVGVPLYARMTRWDAVWLRDVLARLRVPLLAMQSTMLTPERKRVSLHAGDQVPWLELLRAHYARTSTAIVPGVGHFTMLDAPATVNRLLREFAAQIG